MVWRSIEHIAALLEDDERQSVLGDIQERGANLGALLDLIGLVALRQLQSWASWRPWTMAVALLVPATFALMATFPLAQVIYTGHLLSYPSTAGTFLIRPWTAIGAPILAWTTGFTLSHLGKRRTAGVLPLLVIFIAWAALRLQQVLRILPAPQKTWLESLSNDGSFNILPQDRLMLAVLLMVLLAVVPCVFGFRRGLQNHRLPLGTAMILTALLLPSLTILIAPQRPPGFPLLLSLGFQLARIAAIWPIVYALRPVSIARGTTRPTH